MPFALSTAREWCWQRDVERRWIWGVSLQDLGEGRTEMDCEGEPVCEERAGKVTEVSCGPLGRWWGQRTGNKTRKISGMGPGDEERQL